ncbi:tetratricopeptide repeat-containing sulfotransferase family protein [Sphingobium nicotianae]|uniref:Sulfotransferase n=1 Tax=Sphingobium nicotianae TaxID=2782607 RepID=A0A9X1D9V4_9SPHN|nr:sulfotransferase [Sphingobium nicotianae]MBT2186049.1 sulfotransferase [Sphingobium nicotianae]
MKRTYPTPAEVKLSEARSLIMSGRVSEALTILNEVTSHDPKCHGAWFMMGEIGENVQRHDIAARAFGEAHKCDQTDIGSAIRHGIAIARSGQRASALSLAKAISPANNDPATLDMLGTLFTYCEAADRALPLFERAVSLAPDEAHFLFNLSAAQRMNGQLAEAEITLDRVLSLRTDDADAHALRSDLRTQTVDTNHVEELEAAILRAPRGSSAEITLHFAAGKELDDIGRYDEAFYHFAAANRMRRQALNYDVQGDVDVMEELCVQHDKSAIYDGVEGTSAAAPIFVFGLPRSGTTLVESIIARHPDAQAGGEINAFPQATVNAVHRSVGRRLSKNEFVERSLKVDPFVIGTDYLKEVGGQLDLQKRFTDKLPMNYLYAGMIRRALPKARLILLTRDPIDSCLAMFRVKFEGAYPFSYDLDELARYYAAWHKLMMHWQSVCGDALLTISYENLVDDIEENVRKILDHCSLSWDERCLTFHESQRSVTTASASQVRQPLYRSSIKRWKRYEHHLLSLIKKLRELRVNISTDN